MRPHIALPFRRLVARSLAIALVSATLLATAAHAQPRETSHPQASVAKGLPANVEWVDSLAGITQYRLRSNGMNIYVSPNRAAPVVTFLVVYHVGSRNEALEVLAGSGDGGLERPASGFPIPVKNGTP